MTVVLTRWWRVGDVCGWSRLGVVPRGMFTSLVLLDFGEDSMRNFYNKIYYKLNNLNEIMESIDIFENKTKLKTVSYKGILV